MWRRALDKAPCAPDLELGALAQGLELAGGPRRADLLISDSDTPLPHDVTLDGTGTGLGASLTPSSHYYQRAQENQATGGYGNYSYQGVAVGEPAPPYTYTLSAFGTEDLQVSNIALAGPNAGDFAIVNSAGSCGSGTLAHGTSCPITVAFTPTASGSLSATLLVYDNAPDSPQTVALSSTGLRPVVNYYPNGPDAAPNPVTFPPVRPGSIGATMPISLENFGDGSGGAIDLVIPSGAATITGANASSFSLDSDGCSGQIVAFLATCAVGVSFHPPDGSSGTITATLSITDNATSAPQTVTLQGTVATSTMLYAWGQNTYGQLGNGSSDNNAHPTPEQVTGLPPDDPVVTIASGGNHSLALTASGALYAWGLNSNGQLGNGSTTNSSTPVAVTGLPTGDPVIAIAGGSDHNLALTASGTVYAWGYNGQGELGNGNTTNSSTPVAVTGLPSSDPVITIAAGDEHSLALTASGALYAWGYNADGQLGDGSTTDSSTPVAVTGPPASDPVMASGAGLNHSLAAVAPPGSGLGRVSSRVYYGNVAVGDTVTGTATLTSTGVSPLQVYSATTTGPNSRDFAISSGDFTSGGGTPGGCQAEALAPGASCSIDVAFTPATDAARTASLLVYDNAPNSPQAVRLLGYGQRPYASFDSGNTTFGPTLPGRTSATQPFTLTNYGLYSGGPLTLVIPSNAVSIGGAGAGAFHLDSDGCSGQKIVGQYAGANCIVGVSFQPPAGSSGTITATLVITDNAQDAPQTVMLQGTVATQRLTFNPSPVDFGDVVVGSTVDQTVTVTSAGTAPVTLDPISARNNDTNPAGVPAPFSINPSTDMCSNTTITQGGTCTVVVHFLGTNIQSYSGLLVVPIAAGGTQYVTLTGSTHGSSGP